MHLKTKSLLFLFCLLSLPISSKQVKRESKRVPLEELYAGYYKKISRSIFDRYVDEIDKESILLDGLKGLTKSLDPYSKLLVGKKKKYYERLTKGAYGGVGIHLSNIKEILTVLAVLPNTPASKTILRPGDQIVKISGEETKGLSLKECSDRLKGEEGSEVSISILRPETEKNHEIILKREKISLQDLAYSELLDEKNFYIQLKKFSKNIAVEFKASLEEIDKNKLNSLIIDLRGNTGGLLSASLHLLDELLRKDTVILKLSERKLKKDKQQKTKESRFLPDHVKILILIDERSASASEIVAGAIQDLDRGVVIGKNSYGKGLVQKIYKISQKMNLKLTTAKYKTPSGRPIQKKQYGKNESPETEEKEIYTTQKGRALTANGGITPEVEEDSVEIPGPIQELENKNLFLFFAASYKNLYKLTFPLEISDSMIKEFQAFSESYDISFKIPGEKALESLSSSFDKIQNEYTIPEKKLLAEKLQEIKKFYSSFKTSIYEQPIIKKWLKQCLKEKLSYLLEGRNTELKEMLSYDTTLQKALEIANSDEEYNRLLSAPEKQEKL